MIFFLIYILVGNSGVGKQDILNKYLKNEEFQTTIGVEFVSLTVEIRKKICRLQLWDTSGQERYKSITKAYFKNSHCAFIVYDITNRQSFESLNNYIDDCKKYCNKNGYVIILLGNKCEMKNERKVTYDEGKSLADKYRCKFYEISGKNDKNIDNIIKDSIFYLFEIYKNKHEENSNKDGIIFLLDNNKKDAKETSKCIIF